MPRYKGLSNQGLGNLTLYERVMLHTHVENGHLIWEGSLDNHGYPMYHYQNKDKRKRVPVRRFLFNRLHKHENTYITNRADICGVERCVLPAHQKDMRERVKGTASIRRTIQIRRWRAILVRDLARIGFTPNEIAYGMGMPLNTVNLIINNKQGVRLKAKRK